MSSYTKQQQALISTTFSFIDEVNGVVPEVSYSNEKLAKYWQDILLRYKTLAIQFEHLFHFNVSSIAFKFLNNFINDDESMLLPFLHSTLGKIDIDLKPLGVPHKYPHMAFFYKTLSDENIKAIFIKLTNTIRNHIEQFDSLYEQIIATSSPPSLFPRALPPKA